MDNSRSDRGQRLQNNPSTTTSTAHGDDGPSSTVGDQRRASRVANLVKAREAKKRTREAFEEVVGEEEESLEPGPVEHTERSVSVRGNDGKRLRIEESDGSDEPPSKFVRRSDVDGRSGDDRKVNRSILSLSSMVSTLASAFLVAGVSAAFKIMHGHLGKTVSSKPNPDSNDPNSVPTEYDGVDLVHSLFM